MNDTATPFDSLLQPQQAQGQAPVKSDAVATPFDNLITPASNAGQVTNDVGRTVIVPKDGENFADTIARGVAQGKQTTQADIDAEMKTAPKKLAQVAVAAPVIGAAGAAALTGAGEGLGALHDLAVKHLAGAVLPGMEHEAAKQVLMQAVPKVAAFAKTMGELGIGAGGVTYLLKTMLGSK